MSDPVKYANWKQAHHCLINHVGSAPTIEVAGAKLIFNGTIEKHDLRYTEFYNNNNNYGLQAYQASTIRSFVLPYGRILLVRASSILPVYF